MQSIELDFVNELAFIGEISGVEHQLGQGWPTNSTMKMMLRALLQQP